MSTPAPRPVGRTSLRLVGSLLAVVALVAGVAQVVAVWGHGEYRVTASFPASEIDTVEISTASGAVDVIGGDESRITVRVDVSDGLVVTDRDVRVVDRRLVLEASCPWLGQWWCNANYTLRVPRATAVVVTGDAEPVRVTGVDGPVDVQGAG